MTKKQIKQIEDLAKSILIEKNFYLAPIDVHKLCSALTINLEPYEFGEDVSGVYINDGTKSVIGYNMNNVPQRQRFTIAHEIGHYVLGHKRSGIFVDEPSNFFTILYRDANSSTGEYLQEKEANAFAAALLMPKELIEKKIREYYSMGNSQIFFADDFPIVDKLALDFNVSQQAMTFRLTNIDIQW